MKEQNKDSKTKNKKKPIMGLDLDEIKRSLRYEFDEAKQFFIDDERINSLDEMGKLKRWFFVGFWLCKSLFLKLTPIRRLLVTVSVVLFVITFSFTTGDSSVDFDGSFKILGGLILLFVLMLELKDKLLARDELAAGRSVQIALMPETNPEIPGWEVWLYTRPANDVGGDLVDCIRLESKRFGLVLGDVAGKGLSAALFMAKLQSTIRALITEFTSLADLGSKINEIFYRDTISKSFASLVYIELQPDQGTLKILNAGHLPPLLLKKSSVQSLPKGDVALGLLKDTKYNIMDISLKKGEKLFLYSDGVTEAQNKSEEFFGQERLEKLIKDSSKLSARESGENIIKHVSAFAEKSNPQDDLSMVILKRC